MIDRGPIEMREPADGTPGQRTALDHGRDQRRARQSAHLALVGGRGQPHGDDDDIGSSNMSSDDPA